MSVPRSTFTPSVRRGKVYLCGGYSESIEEFDTQTEQYALLAIRLCEAYWSVSVFSEAGELVVVSNTTISRGRVGGEWKTGRIKKKLWPWSQCRPVLKGDVVTMSYKGKFQSVSVKTGEVVKDWT